MTCRHARRRIPDDDFGLSWLEGRCWVEMPSGSYINSHAIWRLAQFAFADKQQCGICHQSLQFIQLEYLDVSTSCAKEEIASAEIQTHEYHHCRLMSR